MLMAEVEGIMKGFSPNNEGKSCYLCLVQGRHDGLICLRYKGKISPTCLP